MIRGVGACEISRTFTSNVEITQTESLHNIADAHFNFWINNRRAYITLRTVSSTLTWTTKRNCKISRTLISTLKWTTKESIEIHMSSRDFCTWTRRRWRMERRLGWQNLGASPPQPSPLPPSWKTRELATWHKSPQHVASSPFVLFQH